MTQEPASALFRESFAWAELAELMADPIFWSPPRTGDGRLVLVLPGLFGNDWYLQPLRSWLDRAGYRSVASALWLNAGCPERLTRQVEQHLDERMRSSHGSAAIIGHSRGGLLARAIASRLQDRASHLILLGSPVAAMTRFAATSGLSSRPASRVAEASARARRLLDPDCDVPFCGCAFPADFLRPLHPETRLVSIYSKDDAIVPAWGCPIPGARNIEVSGTHLGLAHNRGVYRALSEALR